MSARILVVDDEPTICWGLRELLTDVATPPKPRKKTRPSRAAKERRLREKRVQSDRKRSRRKPAEGD